MREKDYVPASSQSGISCKVVDGTWPSGSERKRLVSNLYENNFLNRIDIPLPRKVFKMTKVSVV